MSDLELHELTQLLNDLYFDEEFEVVKPKIADVRLRVIDVLKKREAWWHDG